MHYQHAYTFINNVTDAWRLTAYTDIKIFFIR